MYTDAISVYLLLCFSDRCRPKVCRKEYEHVSPRWIRVRFRYLLAAGLDVTSYVATGRYVRAMSVTYRVAERAGDLFRAVPTVWPSVTFRLKSHIAQPFSARAAAASGDHDTFLPAAVPDACRRRVRYKHITSNLRVQVGTWSRQIFAENRFVIDRVACTSHGSPFPCNVRQRGIEFWFIPLVCRVNVWIRIHLPCTDLQIPAISARCRYDHVYFAPFRFLVRAGTVDLTRSCRKRPELCIVRPGYGPSDPPRIVASTVGIRMVPFSCRHDTLCGLHVFSSDGYD
ncbi:MAG: hypothetical protein JRG73_16465 [Deltaproteobacteria bacterium]|nr:hypothetical protein [Deltaproteobacteria bacterium]